MKVIANRTSLQYGYIKGDILELKHRAWFDDMYHAKNLSNPSLPALERDADLALICANEFDLITDKSPLYRKVVDKEIRFLGIKILTIYKNVEIKL